MIETDVPRPEYPTPQFVRREWMNLNGTWEFGFDDANHGLQQHWHRRQRLPEQITVPFPYQSPLSGIGEKGIHEIVWYARNFRVPEQWQGRDLLLHFGAVDYRTTVWVNGKEIGHNYGGHVPFQFDIAPFLRAGDNRVVLRVEDRQDPHQPRGKQSSTGLPHGIDYYCTTGIWQTVWLEPVPSMRIGELRIDPDVESGMLELRAYLHAPALGWTVEAEVLDHGEPVGQATKRSAMAVVRVRVPVPKAKLWSPESPHLYDLRLRLFRGTELLDEVTSYAGMRKLELADGRFVLNDRPTYLAMVLDQGYWPDSYLTAPSADALRADVECARAFGFNGARKHQKIEDPLWLYWCDRLGLLVWSEMPNARAWSPKSEEMLTAEWTRAIRRDYSHPSIITWVPVNESMGFPGLEQRHPGQYAFLESMVALTRRLDPTRPVIDNDGWEHTDITDICAIHDYAPSSEDLVRRYQSKLEGGDLPARLWSGGRTVFVQGSRYRGQPIMLTEVGGFLSQPTALPRNKWDRLYDYYGSCSDSQELMKRYADLVKGISSLEFLAGFCYTQLTDIEQEMNGLLTYDRKPKIPPEEVARLNSALIQKR